VGSAITLLVAGSAPLIAWFYREPRLVPIALILSTTFVLTTSTVQHMALFKRQMRFKTIARIQVGAVVCGVLLGVGAAALNFGYWAPVAMQWSTCFFTLVFTWCASDWRPQRPRRSVGTRSLLNFGANLTVSSFVWSLARGLDGLLIGRFYGAASLGLYSRAAVLLTRPMEQVVGPVAAVLVPALSRLQSQPERYRRIVLQVYEAMAVSTFLFTGLLLVLAQPIILVVLGTDWQDAAPIFAGFTFVAIYTPVASVASWLLMSQGRGSDFLRQSVIASCLAVVSLFCGVPFGPFGIAVSYSVFCLFGALPLTYYIAGKTGPVSARDLWGCFFTHLPVWGVVCSATWVARWSFGNMEPWAQLVICGTVGLLAGIVFIAVYGPSRRAALNIVQAISELKK
jgi:PST family polysaccharide transporter